MKNKLKGLTEADLKARDWASNRAETIIRKSLSYNESGMELSHIIESHRPRFENLFLQGLKIFYGVDGYKNVDSDGYYISSHTISQDAKNSTD